MRGHAWEPLVWRGVLVFRGLWEASRFSAERLVSESRLSAFLQIRLARVSVMLLVGSMEQLELLLGVVLDLEQICSGLDFCPLE